MEQPGSWGPDALRQSGLPERQGRELVKRTKEAGIRTVLIRRGVRLSSERRQCYFARTDERNVYLSHLTLDTLDDLLDVDLTPLPDGGRIESSIEQRDPVYLICTHGRHDACCAIRGNQVARIACAAPDVDAWECSHIGGDRFAANLVCFPHGVYFGRVTPDSAPEIMSAYSHGQLSLAYYRGRSCYGFAVQAAEFFLRQEMGFTEIDAVSLVAASRSIPGRLAATFAITDGTQAQVEIRISKSGEGYRLTCSSPDARPIPRYDLIRCVL